ncbi:hypothetical protein SAMN05216567_12293 [Variovorax sp. OK605]|jgi:hypothetical protein|uniref:hypothetical protein n=1 Tax=unclassified Variovorax TaxID=663243 RepID=UPI0008C6D2D2|nr:MULTISPECIES: hypothetical protein [unclassified Variovorax]SEK15941.1 hypothetical protein SAMN05518853_12031 [Variovorax sp. OK202]SFE25440.1 hypothetical protein SAMN05444746_12031 [Variovorax sp. OK212]SFQ62469.1 hypothetical protein SAMN05216567_12293 [Variovorax sp. OK605]
MRSLALFLSIFAAAAGAHAEVVRCTDAKGAISYTNVECPAGSKQSRQVQILEAPAPDPNRRPDYAAPSASPAPPPAQVAANPPSGPAIIPRYPAGTQELQQQQPAADPPVVILSPDPYYDGARPIRRPPPHLRDPGPPPGQRPCQNLAGIKRSNC